MIDLYASVTPNVVKILIALEEMALPYELHVVELLKGANFEPEFVKLSPTAKVPVIVDRDSPAGRPYAVFESGAILIYLAEKTGLFLPRDPAGRHDAIQWLMMQMANVGPAFGQFAHFSHYAPQDKAAYSRDRFRTIVRNLLDVIETRLEASSFIAGRDYTIADMALLPWMQVIDFLLGKGAAADYRAIQAWAQRLTARPAVMSALEAADKLRGKVMTPDQAAPAALDRLLGRGAYARP